MRKKLVWFRPTCLFLSFDSFDSCRSSPYTLWVRLSSTVTRDYLDLARACLVSLSYRTAWRRPSGVLAEMVLAVRRLHADVSAVGLATHDKLHTSKPIERWKWPQREVALLPCTVEARRGGCAAGKPPAPSCSFVFRRIENFSRSHD